MTYLFNQTNALARKRKITAKAAQFGEIADYSVHQVLITYFKRHKAVGQKYMWKRDVCVVDQYVEQYASEDGCKGSSTLSARELAHARQLYRNIVAKQESHAEFAQLQAQYNVVQLRAIMAGTATTQCNMPPRRSLAAIFFEEDISLYTALFTVAEAATGAMRAEHVAALCTQCKAYELRLAEFEMQLTHMEASLQQVLLTYWTLVFLLTQLMKKPWVVQLPDECNSLQLLVLVQRLRRLGYARARNAATIDLLYTIQAELQLERYGYDIAHVQHLAFATKHLAYKGYAVIQPYAVQAITRKDLP